MLNISRIAIIAAGSILGLGAINANPSQAATISYEYETENYVTTKESDPFLLKVSGSFSFDDALGKPGERELSSFTMKWEIPEAAFNFDFSDFTEVPKFDQSSISLLGSWEVPELVDSPEVPNVGLGGTFEDETSYYLDEYVNVRGNYCGEVVETGDSICTLMAFTSEVRYKHVGEETISQSVPEPSSVLGSLTMGVIAVGLGFRVRRSGCFRK